MKTFMTVRETAREGLVSEYALRLMLKSKNPPPHVQIGHRALINYPLFVEWLDARSRDGGILDE